MVSGSIPSPFPTQSVHSNVMGSMPYWQTLQRWSSNPFPFGHKHFLVFVSKINGELHATQVPFLGEIPWLSGTFMHSLVISSIHPSVHKVQILDMGSIPLKSSVHSIHFLVIGSIVSIREGTLQIELEIHWPGGQVPHFFSVVNPSNLLSQWHSPVLSIGELPSGQPLQRRVNGLKPFGH